MQNTSTTLQTAKECGSAEIISCSYFRKQIWQKKIV